MATLILNAVGAAVGGPVGAAIGANIGRLIDQRIFAPKGRQGPRLGDLAFQSSAYGARMPKLFGAVRVSGTVIWATDLKESRGSQSTGKGRPKQTVFSYSASFAVALSLRRIKRIGRIWADGKLLRGAAGDFKVETGFRVHDGAEDQAVDPLIASVQGIGLAPAYRGTAYVVFEDLQLADYGNRIPSISFEVFADDGAISVDTLVSDIAPDVASHCPTQLGGFAVSGDSVRGVLETITTAVPLYVRDADAGLSVSELPNPVQQIARDDLGAAPSNGAAPRLSIERRSEDTALSHFALRFYDPARDYQTGLQRTRQSSGARRDTVIDFPATLSAADAASLVDRLWAAQRAEQDMVEIVLPSRYIVLRPGDTLQVPGIVGVWRAVTVAFEAMTVRVALVPLPLHLPSRTSATSGTGIYEADQPHGPTVLRLLDLPYLADGVAAAPQVFVVAAGTMPGWRKAALLMSVNGGASWEGAGGTAAPATMGSVQVPLGDAQTNLVGESDSMLVTLLHDGTALHSITRAQLLAGENLALVGDELLQFERAERVGPAQYRLTGLLRGRRGTEWAVTTHGANAPFTLIEPGSLAPLSIPGGVADVRVMASGVGDTAPVLAQLSAPGRALLPLSPVRLTSLRMDNGDVVISWTRRSRDGWRWSDGVDAPLAEERERYSVALSSNIGAVQNIEVIAPQWTYSAAAIAADRAFGATSMTISIAQIGTFGSSRRTAMTIAI